MSKPTKILAVVGILIVASFLAWKYLPRTQSPGSGGQPSAPVALERQAAEPTAFSFDRAASLNEEIPLVIRFRDLSNLPTDFSDFNEATKNVPGMEGSASFKVLSMAKTGRIGLAEPLGPDETYWFAIYEFQGDPDNPTGRSVRPSSVMETGPDMAPQLVLVDGDEVMNYSSDESKAKAKADGTFWHTYASLTSDTRRTLVAVWRLKAGIKPILALAYMGMDDTRHFIRINY